MARVLLCPLSGYGQIYPLVGLALELVANSHEVALATGTDHEALLARHHLVRLPSEGGTDAFGMHDFGTADGAAKQFDHTMAAIRRWAPDAVVTNLLAAGAVVAAQHAGVPVAVLGVGAYLWPTAFADPASALGRRQRETWVIFHELHDAVRSRLGLPPVGVPEGAESAILGDRYLLPSVPELVVDPDGLPARVGFVGNCTWDPGVDDPDVERWLTTSDATLPLYYVQLGQVYGRPSFFPALLTAVAGDAVRVVADVGRSHDDIGPVPDNVLVRRRVPQHQVLPRSTAVICNGNTTAVLGALSHGLPLGLFPSGGEQPDVAYCCAHAGVAVRRSAERTDNAAMRQLLRGLASDVALRARAAAMAPLLGTSAQGLARAAQLVTDLAT